MNQGSELPWLGGRPERCPLGGRLMTHRTHSWGEKDNIWGDWRVHPLIHCETNYIRLLNLGLALSKGTMELELVGKMSHGLENGWYWLVGSNPGKAWGLTWVRKIRELFPKASKSETIKSLFDDGPQFWGTHCRTHSDRIETYHRMAELYTVPHFSFFLGVINVKLFSASLWETSQHLHCTSHQASILSVAKCTLYMDSALCVFILNASHSTCNTKSISLLATPYHFVSQGRKEARGGAAVQMGFVVADARFERACRPLWAVGPETGGQNQDRVSLYWLRGRIAFGQLLFGISFSVNYGNSPTAACLSSWKKLYIQNSLGLRKQANVCSGCFFLPSAFNTSSWLPNPNIDVVVLSKYDCSR